MKMKTAIVIPVHNEEKNIPLLVEDLLKLKRDFWIIFVNDNSSDKSKKVIQDLMKKNDQIKMVDRRRQEGLGEAIISGLKKAIEMNVSGAITMDGDLSHPTQKIPELIREGKTYDLVIGSRFIKDGSTEKWSFQKKLMSFIARHTSRVVLNIKTRDCSSGMKYYSKEILDFYDFDSFISSGYAFQIETVLLAEKNQFKIKEIPITFKGRKYGESKVDFSELKRYIKSVGLLLKIRN